MIACSYESGGQLHQIAHAGLWQSRLVSSDNIIDAELKSVHSRTAEGRGGCSLLADSFELLKVQLHAGEVMLSAAHRAHAFPERSGALDAP